MAVEQLLDARAERIGEPAQVVGRQLVVAFVDRVDRLGGTVDVHVGGQRLTDF